MKKVLLALSMIYGFGSMAQNAVSAPAGTHPATAEETARIVNAIKAKQNGTSAKTAGGVVNQRMSHADIADSLFGADLSVFIQPIFQDSLVMQDFGTVEPVDIHGFAQTFDVYTAVHSYIGNEPFHTTDPYTVDTIYAAGFYDVLSNKTATFTGDTLIMDIVYGAPTSNAMWRQGLQWPANTWSNQPTAASILPVMFTGNASEGYAGDVTWANKITIKKALTPADSAVTYHKFTPPTPISVPAGARFGVSLRFKSGEAYNTGDIYFAGSGSTSSAVMNSFRVAILGATSSGDDNAYFLEEFSLGVFSWASSQLLFSSQRYNPVSNSFYTPQGALGGFFDIWVSGISTFGINEGIVSSDLKVFPNPSNGEVTIEIAQGGNYTLELINMVGQVVSSENVTVNGNEKLKRNFSSVPKGVYLLSVNGENFSKTTKLTIE